MWYNPNRNRRSHRASADIGVPPVWRRVRFENVETFHEDDPLRNTLARITRNVVRSLAETLVYLPAQRAYLPYAWNEGNPRADSNVPTVFVPATSSGTSFCVEYLQLSTARASFTTAAIPSFRASLFEAIWKGGAENWPQVDERVSVVTAEAARTALWQCAPDWLHSPAQPAGAITAVGNTALEAVWAYFDLGEPPRFVLADAAGPQSAAK